MGIVTSSPIALYTSLAVLAFVIYKAYGIYFRTTHLSKLPGPAKPHIFWGHQNLVWSHDPGVTHERWTQEHGHVLKFNSLGNGYRLLTTDVRAMAHVLHHSEVYHKPWRTQKHLGSFLGFGLLVSEGEKHRMQRKALNPAFGPGPLRELTGIILDKANELRDVLSAQILASHSASTEVEMLSWLSRATLDIIGLAGFGYDFGSVASGGSQDEAGEENELLGAFQTMFGIATQTTMLHALTILFPALRSLPTAQNLELKKAMATMRQIGTRLIDERKLAAVAEAAQGEKLVDSRARDLLSLLVRANTVATAKERLSDEDVLSQIPTFLVAGHETTSTLLSWIIFRLSQQPEVATALREECHTNPLPKYAQGNSPLTTDELSAMDHLPLLDAIVREALRLHAPVTQTVRRAMKDDILPLAKPFIDGQGEVHNTVRISKGDDIIVPVLLVNRSIDLWGPDAHEWNPRRWIDGTMPESVKGVPGVWGNVLSFLAGSHACIGFRLSLFEAKIILHALISEFTFELTVPAAEIGAKGGIVSRPIVNARKHEGAQLPVILREAKY